jgi:hypothetical protein
LKRFELFFACLEEHPYPEGMFLLFLEIRIRRENGRGNGEEGGRGLLNFREEGRKGGREEGRRLRQAGNRESSTREIPKKWVWPTKRGKQESAEFGNQGSGVLKFFQRGKTLLYITRY